MDRKSSINSVQKDMLIQFIKENPNLQSGKFSSEFTFKKAQSLWEEISAQLNSVPNATQKYWRQWRKENRGETEYVVELGGEEILEHDQPSESKLNDHDYTNKATLDVTDGTRTPKKMNKTTRLTKSLEISHNLLKSGDKRNSLLDEYYNEKIKYYRNKNSYFNEKLQLEKETVLVLNDIKDILNVFAQK